MTTYWTRRSILHASTPKRPKQANLRRAVSAAYYALFHLLASEASALYAGESELAARISRTLNHAEMKKASALFARGYLPRALQAPNASDAVSGGLRNVADAFVELQGARHQADYSLIRTFARKEVLEYVEKSRRAFGDWMVVRKTDHARLYLACFLLGKRWDDEPR